MGKCVRVGTAGPWREVIGVVGDVHENGVHVEAPATVYWRAGVQQDQEGAPSTVPRAVTFAIRSDRTGTESFLGQIREAVWAVNPNLPLSQVRTLADVRAGSMARTSFTLVMLAVSGSMALALGLIGVYGVISYTVTQRTREVGIRVALGAKHGDVKGMFIRHGLTLTCAGVAIGLVAAIG